MIRKVQCAGRALRAAAPFMVALLLAGAGKGGDKLDEVFASFAKVKTVKGKFVQAKKLAAFKDVQLQEGWFKTSADGKVLYVVTGPVKSIFAVKGGKALVRYPDLGWEEVTDLESSPTIGAAVKSILAVLGATSAAHVRDAYQASVKKEKAGGWTLTLRPKDDMVKKAIDRVVMRVQEDARVTHVGIYEKSGDSTLIDFSDIVFNEPVDDPLLDF